MKFTTVSVSYSRKFNLGDYESLELGCSLWAQVEDGEDADGITQFLYHQAKASVKQAAMPVLKASEFQKNKAKSSKKASGDINESDGKTVLRTHIFHESGESITSTYPLPEIGDSQKFGAALTYARRYAVCAILSVTADEDNDAESATTQKPEQPHNNIRPRKDNQQYRVQPTKQAVTPPSINPKDLRVKEVRTLLNYPLDLVKEWLHFQNVSSPSELDSAQIDELVKTMCLACAGNKFGHPNHAVNSYQKHVIDAVLRGVSEMEAIQVWMEGALAQIPELN